MLDCTYTLYSIKHSRAVQVKRKINYNIADVRSNLKAKAMKCDIICMHVKTIYNEQASVTHYRTGGAAVVSKWLV